MCKPASANNRQSGGEWRITDGVQATATEQLRQPGAEARKLTQSDAAGPPAPGKADTSSASERLHSSGCRRGVFGCYIAMQHGLIGKEKQHV